jgi:hypothetical protein
VTTYPIDANADLIDGAQMTRFIETLFRHVDWQGEVVSLLGIGEKGTAQEGVLRDRQFVAGATADTAAYDHARRWASWHGGCFIVPAVVKPGAVIARDVTLDKVAALTAIVLDLDSGDIDDKVHHAVTALGPPTMTVASGGETDAGMVKRHLYWLLSEPSEEVERVAALRKMLAAKCGGDQSFGRATQVVRVPGTVHAKNGVAKLCRIIEQNDTELHLDDAAEAIEAMLPMPGLPVAAAPLLSMAAGMMDFSRAAGMEPGRAVDALHRDVHAGGEDLTRWGEFSKVCGFYIAEVRGGRLTADQAVEAAYGWMLAHMVPPWPRQRFEQEFQGLIRKDVQNHGPFPQAVAQPAPGSTIEVIDSTESLLTWAANRRSHTVAPQRRVLVEGQIFSGKRHMIVAEGGAGKTGAVLELALKLAASGPTEPTDWFGNRVMEEAHGGTVIVMTGEDDLEELDIRWNALDPGGRLRAVAGDRLIALPLDNLGGAFPLVAHHPATREAVASARWVALYNAIAGIKAAGGKVTAVIIDTLNSTLHGEENSAAIVGEYIRAVSPICGELGAALIVTHHVRKPGQEPIRTVDDMRDAIRGSTALPNAMRVVIGLWPAHDYDRRMKAMGLKPERGQMFRLAIVKANVPEASRTVQTLLRDKNGLLVDATQRDSVARGPTAEQEAWLVFAVQKAADMRALFAISGENGLFARRSQLPRELRNMARDEIEAMARRMIAENEPLIELRPVMGTGKGHKYLDTPAGRHIGRAMDNTKGFRIDYSRFFYDHGYDAIREVEL